MKNADIGQIGGAKAVFPEAARPINIFKIHKESFIQESDFGEGGAADQKN